MVKRREVHAVSDLLEAQPILVEIVRNAKKQAKFASNIWQIYEQAKREAYLYVGWGCDTEELETEKAYSLFLHYLCYELGI